MRQFATKRQGGQLLSFILFDDGNDWEHSPERPVVLDVVEFLHTPKQALIADQDFTSVEEALDYCRTKYSIETDDWRRVLPFILDFRIEYDVTHTGTPQPVLLSPQGGELVFRVTADPTSSPPDTSTYDLQICGTKEGLRRMAAWLLLCAESERFDLEYHRHFERGQEAEGNASVTLRCPTYLNILRDVAQKDDAKPLGE